MDIQIDLGQGSFVSAKLEFKKDQNDVTIQCLSNESEKHEIILQENLNQFSLVKVDDDNPLRLTMCGDNIDRTFIFQSTTNVSDFFTKLQENVKLTMQTGKSRVFQLSKKQQQQASLSGYIEKGIAGGFNMVKNFVQQQNQSSLQASGVSSQTIKQLNKNDDFNQIIPTDGFELGYVDQEFPKSIRPQMLTDVPKEDPEKEKISQIKFSETLLMNKEIMECFLLLFSNGQSQDDMFSKYTKLKQQWANIGKGQWDHSFCLRKYVVEAESSIRNSQCAVEPYDTILFDILMSLFSFYFQKLDFDPVSVHFLEIFIKYFILHVSSDSQTFTASTGSKLTKDQMEALIFWTFKDFFAKFLYSSSTKYLLKGDLLSKVNNILLFISPSTAAMLEEYEVKSLVFMKSHQNTLFTRERSNNDTALMICAISSAKDPFLFYQCLVAGILVVLQARLQECESLHEFGETFDALVPNIDIRLILHNGEKIYSIYLQHLEEEKQKSKE